MNFLKNGNKKRYIAHAMKNREYFAMSPLFEALRV
jgi:hypothetical protein